MSFSKKFLLGSLLAVSATSAFAVETADLRVIGTIAPGACTPVFAGGATVDYGVIPLASLSQTADTALGSRDVNYTISCNAPIAISATWSDARAASVTNPNAARYGLGTHNGTNIGRYGVSYVVAGTTADGNPITLIQRANPTAAWTAGVNTIGTSPNGLLAVSFAKVGEVVPSAFSTYAGTIRVTTLIDPIQNLDTTTDVALDGLSTMTVNYL
ncbi:DUF1120 domain-containing protein [Pseudomonas sp. SWRI111]|uniref:DUF1120 domain-containing protein n=1 Tax=Pseudomonas sp. SWRI111 TaxID=2745507 RepID=UPI0016467720|nr:DUF1120 domain-containing protein [Pseudomonas sp. SWRI111]MBC3209341.1 DUF1120 domain-containing protein [Pseudomonas sp. SWRI111]